MKALITGASTGIGRDMARNLHARGIDLILVARSADLLDKLKNELDGKPRIICLDLSAEDNCRKLYEETKSENIHILINNAGFGTLGDYSEVDLETELNMIDLNIKALHILTKLFVADFEKRNSGYILNVASIAAFMSGPLMATYYATKGYVLRYSTALCEELRRKQKNVHISVLCPGPVATEFDRRAGVKSSLGGLSSKKVADYAIKKMLKGKLLIVPGFSVKLGIFGQRCLPMKTMLRICYSTQKRKR